jgi:hypothetical protein
MRRNTQRDAREVSVLRTSVCGSAHVTQYQLQTVPWRMGCVVVRFATAGLTDALPTNNGPEGTAEMSLAGHRGAQEDAAEVAERRNRRDRIKPWPSDFYKLESLVGLGSPRINRMGKFRIDGT